MVFDDELSCIKSRYVENNFCDNVNKVDDQICEISNTESISMEENNVNNTLNVIEDNQINDSDASSNTKNNNEIFEEDSQLYNSYNYWFIDPNMPLDPKLVNESKNGLRKGFDSVVSVAE